MVIHFVQELSEAIIIGSPLLMDSISAATSMSNEIKVQNYGYLSLRKNFERSPKM